VKGKDGGGFRGELYKIHLFFSLFLSLLPSLPFLSMVTGDHLKTAAAIAREVAILSPDGNLPTDMIMAAQDFDACCDAQVKPFFSLVPPHPPSSSR